MNTEVNHEMISTGVCLRHAREQLQLSQQTVAKRLCLKVSVIRDIEEGKKPTDLDTIFLYGYIRSYAKLVHIPEDKLLLSIKKQTSILAGQAAPIQTFSLGQYQEKRNSWLVIILTCLVLFLTVGLSGIWWWQKHKARHEEMITITDNFFSKLNSQTDNQAENIPLSIGDGSQISILQMMTADTCQTVQYIPKPITSTATIFTLVKTTNSIIPPSPINIRYAVYQHVL